MDSQIIELLRLKGMGYISSFLLQNYWAVLATIMILIVGFWVVLVGMAWADLGIIKLLVFVLLGVIIGVFILLKIGTEVQTPLNNLESISTNKKINITEYHGDYILDKNNHKYKIGLMKNINTSSFYKRSWFKDQINGHDTQVKLIKYKGDNIIINYTPQKRTVKGYDN